MIVYIEEDERILQAVKVLRGRRMQERIDQLQKLFKKQFERELQEHELYGYLQPRLIKAFDTFLDKEVSNKELINLTSFLSEKLYGNAILEETAPSNDFEDLPDSLKTPSTELEVVDDVKLKSVKSPKKKK
jgi:hypothetical protein